MSSKIAEKMARVASKVGYLQKGGYNEGQNYYYASAEQVLRAVNKELANEGIATSVEHLELRTGQREGKKGGIMIDAIMRLRVHFIDSETGEKLSSDGAGQGCDSGDKAVMKATTAAYKYAMAGAFQISWGDDPEADASTDAPSAPPAPVAKAAEEKAVEAPSKPPRARRQAKATEAPPATEEALLLAISLADTSVKLNALIGPLTDYKAKNAEIDPDSVARVVDAFKARLNARGKETQNG